MIVPPKAARAIAWLKQIDTANACWSSVSAIKFLVFSRTNINVEMSESSYAAGQ